MFAVRKVKVNPGTDFNFPTTDKYNIKPDTEWMRLQNPVLELLSRDIIYTVIHNIVANKERVHKFNMIAFPNCPSVV